MGKSITRTILFKTKDNSYITKKMAANKFVAMFMMCMIVAAAMNLVVEAGDPNGAGTEVYKKCFADCQNSCQGGETHCEMSCDEKCDEEETRAKVNGMGKKLKVRLNMK